MLLLVGLGNPEPAYAGNRHNIGFMAVDEIARRHSFGPWRRRFLGLATRGHIAGATVIGLKPLTFVNGSGRSVGAALRYYRLSAQDVTVIHDDLDLAPARLRVKTGGGNAGHKGLVSIDAHIGSGYRRVRLGIGHPGDQARVADYVLTDFAKDDRAWLGRILAALAEAAPDLVKGDDSGFMNKVSLAMAQARAQRTAPGQSPRERSDGL
ncbi:MAG: aminoacyl-tRNA hydrolase [Alphaproteobacteria bacterium]